MHGGNDFPRAVPQPRPLGLEGNLADYRDLSGPDIFSRVAPFHAWQKDRRLNGFWPYARSLDSAPGNRCAVKESDGTPREGVNFASQDYLSLSRHPAVVEAAIAAAREFGVHSAGSAVLVGNTRYSRQLEHTLADVLRMEHVVLFPTGWGAGFGAITGLVRQRDYVVLDMLCHACLQNGAMAATTNVARFAHNNTGHLEQVLQQIRERDAKNAILVVTEGLFSMDGDVPDLVATQEVCRSYGATLLVDIAHDFGAMGQDGTGSLGNQHMLGSTDLVMGSFSKTFASNGGFVACNAPDVADYLKCFASPHTFSNALSPVQAASVLAASGIVFSSEGSARRQRLFSNINALRSSLAAQKLTCLGTASPIVPVLVGREDLARVASRKLIADGVVANLVEYPAVPPGRARFRFQVMADHNPELATLAAEALGRSIDTAKVELDDRR